MTYTVVGLGNPGEEYVHTRHNIGAAVVRAFRDAHEFPLWKAGGKGAALISKEKLGKIGVVLMLPQTHMNVSGKAVRLFVKSIKAARMLVVAYDDLDLPLGVLKISFGRSSGGHRGLESVIRSIHTKDFIRLRVGISPATKKGMVKKPSGEKEVIDYILGKLSIKEQEAYKDAEKRAVVLLGRIIEFGWQKAASLGTNA